ncbi:hypothetical protein BG006_011120 [Podila minutissima]|uniref:Uncharacterized protein n=1 Tax=Podila minutissima TaxID=64525 RepID=A0A9P5SQ30_9FUNG|nr:hypothetical protein BG006_011120 [Podila minutissima]
MQDLPEQKSIAQALSQPMKESAKKASLASASMSRTSRSSLLMELRQDANAKPKSYYSLKVLEELYNTHDIVIPRDILPWTDADTAILDIITGFNIMSELLKEEYSKNTEGMEPRDLDMAKSYSGSGYVYYAGNGQFSYLVASIQFIRDVFKSNMPLQVFYVCDQDLSPSRQEYMWKMTTNIEVVDIIQIFDNEYLQLNGWAHHGLCCLGLQV